MSTKDLQGDPPDGEATTMHEQQQVDDALNALGGCWSVNDYKGAQRVLHRFLREIKKDMDAAQPSPVPPDRQQVLRDMRCAVTQCRCDEFGCAAPGATIMPPEWRCHVCAAYELIAAFPSPVVPSQDWQPIGTHDGSARPVLIYIPEDEDGPGEITVATRDEDGWTDTPSGWTTDVDTPTHWMPLPKPPVPPSPVPSQEKRDMVRVKWDTKEALVPARTTYRELVAGGYNPFGEMFDRHLHRNNEPLPEDGEILLRDGDWLLSVPEGRY